jgi:repressor LexA
MRRLTRRQSEILRFIQGFLKERGYPPTVREIGTHFGFGPRSSKEHLDLIEKKGYIRRRRGARTIELTRSAREGLEGIPLVGRVAAGVPLLAQENLEGFIQIDSGSFGGEGIFFLQVKGESMSGSGINDKDFVLVVGQKTARNGDIVVARIGDEATVKEFRRVGRSVELLPHNENFKTLELEEGDDFEIVGRVIGLWRRI